MEEPAIGIAGDVNYATVDGIKNIADNTLDGFDDNGFGDPGDPGMDGPTADAGTAGDEPPAGPAGDEDVKSVKVDQAVLPKLLKIVCGEDCDKEALDRLVEKLKSMCCGEDCNHIVSDECIAELQDAWDGIEDEGDDEGEEDDEDDEDDEGDEGDEDESEDEGDEDEESGNPFVKESIKRSESGLFIAEMTDGGLAIGDNSQLVTIGSDGKVRNRAVSDGTNKAVNEISESKNVDLRTVQAGELRTILNEIGHRKAQEVTAEQISTIKTIVGQKVVSEAIKTEPVKTEAVKVAAKVKFLSESVRTLAAKAKLEIKVTPTTDRSILMIDSEKNASKNAKKLAEDINLVLSNDEWLTKNGLSDLVGLKSAKSKVIDGKTYIIIK